jgi:hypothetical protein
MLEIDIGILSRRSDKGMSLKIDVRKRVVELRRFSLDFALRYSKLIEGVSVN